MNGNLLKAFVAVVKEGSFSRAAEHLFISQPALSQNIKQLETHFAVPLIKRTAHGLTLTGAGEVFYSHAVKICADIELMEEEMSAFRSALKETLQIGATNVIGGFAVPCSIFIFKNKHPEANVKLKIGNRRQTMEQLQQDAIDIAIVEGDKPDDNFLSSEIHSEEMVVVAPKQAPWETKSRLSLEELRQAPLIIREEGSATRDTLERTLGSAGLGLSDLNVVMELYSVQSIKAAVEAGHGVSILPRLAVKTELFNKTMLRLQIENLSFSQPIHIVYKRKKRPPVAVDFINFMKSPSNGFC